MSAYAEFLERKAQIGTDDGFKATWVPDFLFDFQAHLVDWAVWKGRGATLADCGLGKSVLELVWGQNVVEHTNRPVIIFAPLAVTHQLAREGAKFGIEAHVSIDGKVRPGINIANYERIHYFDANDFAGAACDESAAIKSFDSVRKQQVTDFMRKMRYRQLYTATPAPNEYIELGTSSEALGYLGYMDMLSRFFKNNQGNSIKPFTSMHRGTARKPYQELQESAKWRFKGHAEAPFWRWVCSWARAVRKPSDLGFDDGPFVLPPLIEQQHVVEARTQAPGQLFALPAIGLKEQREERRRTITERCERAAELVNHTGKPAVVWCHLNDEGDLLQKLIPDAIQISGKDNDDAKEAKFLSFLDRDTRILILKPKIGAWGMNFQHCAHSVSFPTHSFEESYQSIRRFWRFGQTQTVVSDIVTTEGEKSVLENLQRKSIAADKMFGDLTRFMHDAVAVDRSIEFTKEAELPSWM